MTSNCGCQVLKNPSGLWEYWQLVGAKVYVKSMPTSNFFRCADADEPKTIKDVYFRITTDGKTVTVIELEEYPGKIFTWRDLSVVELKNTEKVNPICGTFECGITLCGLGVDKGPSYIDDLSGGITIVDQNGNIISNRKVRFIGASVEDIRTDENDITDINIDKLKNINGGTF